MICPVNITFATAHAFHLLIVESLICGGDSIKTIHEISMEVDEALFFDQLAFHIYFWFYPLVGRNKFLRIMRNAISGFYFLRYCVKGKSSNNVHCSFLVFTSRQHMYFKDECIYSWLPVDPKFEYETAIAYILDISWLRLYLNTQNDCVRSRSQLLLQRIDSVDLFREGCSRMVVPDVFRKNIGDETVLASVLMQGFGMAEESLIDEWLRHNPAIPSITDDYCELYLDKCEELNEYLKKLKYNDKVRISTDDAVAKAIPEIIHHSAYRREVDQYG